MSYDIVEMVKQFPDDVNCFALTIYDDVVYFGGYSCVIQWNVVTDSVVRLDGYANRLI